ncbi:MAG: TetR/AcrR family transcriptional regulator [Solirubrobacterales bacterium]
MAAKTRSRSTRKKTTGGTPRQRRQKARQRIISSALKQADKGSFSELTIDAIARSAGVSRPAFYTHFSDKEELLLVAVGEVSQQLYEMADRWWHGIGPPAQRVRQAIEGVVSVYAGEARLLRIAAEVATYDYDVRALWLDIAGRFIEATADHIRSEQQAGLIPRTLDPRSTAEALFWMAERSCYIYLGRSERTAKEVVRGLLPVWVAALYPGVIPAGQLSPRAP